MRLETESARRTSHGTLLWIAQGLLALIFVATGGMKLTTPAAELTRMMPLPLPIPFVRFIGTAEVLGALGLVLPGALRIMPQLTSLAAAGLTIIMIGATVVTLIAGGGASALVPAAIGVIGVAIAVGRRVRPARDVHHARIHSAAR